MTSLGTYSFLPWLRRGLANQITTADHDPTVIERAHISVTLAVDGEKLAGGTEHATVTKPIALYGPGDITGFEGPVVVRTEPRHLITNFEPNYLAHVEVYDEDYLWRYTPAAPDVGKGRLRPWVALVVLTESEFTEGKAVKERALPYIDITNPAVLPPADELWAWAHVHVNRDLAASEAEFVSTDGPQVAQRLLAVLAQDRDLAYGRLVCPRRLVPDTAYHAFVIPTFEVGRRTGLKLDLTGVPATRSAWDGANPGPEPASHPYLYRWSFHTGASGDFETLVRLLRPKPVDRRVGQREMDTQFPGSNVDGVDNPDLHGILMLGGALRPPTLVPPEPPDVFERWDSPFPRPLQEDLAGLVNRPDDYQRAGDPDPIVAPPLYGRWHALVSRVLRDADGNALTPAETWVQRLNLDPRFRVAAGLGTRVVQDQQERYMNAAWEQVGAVLEAQRRIRFGQFGVRVSAVWHQRHVLPWLGAQRALSLIAPVGSRLRAGGTTLRYAMSQSLVQPTHTSAALRRMTRPRGRLIRSLPFDAARPASALLDRVNAGEVSAAPPITAPAGALTATTIADRLTPAGAPGPVLALLRRFPQLPLWTLLAGLALGVLLLCVGLAVPLLGVGLGAVAVGAGVVGYQTLIRWQQALAAADAVGPAGQTVAAVDALPGAAGFQVVPLGTTNTVMSGVDSPEAVRLKAALRDSFAFREAGTAAGLAPVRTRLDLAGLAGSALAGLDPALTVTTRIRAGIGLPARIRAELGEGFVEPMAYPVIDEPMYQPLRDLGPDLFLPNVNLIENNTVTLLEVNQRFIEAYLVGVNHEFARELLWREYPTDQRGTPFRQFWDVRGHLDTGGGSPEQARERLRDIPPLHRWSRTSKLGTHDNRDTGGPQEDELVLVIRGELLKRYPTAVIYAHRARWQRDPEPNGPIARKLERRFVPLEASEEDSPPRTKVLTPLYEAKIEPDIYLFGFDLTAAQARGGTGEHDNDDAGWFFVIKERPGELRLGLDDDKQPVLQTWNDLSWPDLPSVAPGGNITIAATPATFTLQLPTGADSEKKPQYDDDIKVKWSHDMHAGTLAYILFQAPVLVGVHAAEMLPR